MIYFYAILLYELLQHNEIVGLLILILITLEAMENE